MNAIYHPRYVFPIIDISSLWIKDLKKKKKKSMLLKEKIDNWAEE